jgi:DNA-binding CsgD family transcriptional regulator
VTPGRPDPIRIVEAAYTWASSEASWLDAVVQAASPYEIGGGVIAYTVRIAGRTTVEALSKTERASEDDARVLRRQTERFPAQLAHEVCAPTEFVGNGAFRLSRLARSHRGPHAALAQRTRESLPALWALISGDPRLRTLMMCFPGGDRRTRSMDEPFPHRDARSLGLVGAHLSAALRLRALVRPTADDAGTEAVLSPEGKLLHATSAASSPAARRSLVEAVQASETARGRMRRSSPDEALGLWIALVQGRWTIVDSVERDGKRLLLARKNPVDGVGLLGLSRDECDVAWLAAFGHSYKYIAYELGVPMSTVAGRLRRAMRKLRVRSRVELLQKMGTPDRQQ